MITAGVDVGCSVIKIVVMNDNEIIYKNAEKIRKRDPRIVAEEGYKHALNKVGIEHDDVSYAATTGEGDMLEFRTGHFYGMTTHARGGLFLNNEARAALDVGALHARAMLMDDKGRVLQYRMTSQCASGSGQFLENISRYLGISIDEIGQLSQESKKPEPCSSICAVLAETDVINMVSRGIKREDILKGIHLAIAGRLMKLLRASKAQGTVILTGGLSLDVGLQAALNELRDMEEEKKGAVAFKFTSHEDGIFAGALGAAIWGAFRYNRAKERFVA